MEEKNHELEWEENDANDSSCQEEQETVTQPDETGDESVCCSQLKNQLEEQKKEAEDLSNRLIRLQADFDNFRRRSRKDAEEIARFGSERVILSLLPVIDNFERALAAAEGKTELAQFATGMDMIYRQLKEALEKEGMSVIPAVNEVFDPNKHHAIAQVETDEYEDNTIIDEIHKGYALHDKVLRPSGVRVAKNSSKESD